MTINPTITEELERLFKGTARNLEEDNRKISSGLLYLLAVYFNLDDSGIPAEIIRTVNISKICERNYTVNSLFTVQWNIPLFLEEGKKEEVDDNWDWIDTEYRPMFGALRSDAVGTKSTVHKKMRDFFATHPHIRKDDVIAAARLYLETNSGNVKFVQQADYFIKKKVDGVWISRLEMFLEVIKNTESQGVGKYMGGLVR